jgi:prolyl-tRNA editing enzyme YbaK/EbsC (Cys-tRNA(Pro) deacylase)
MIPVGQSPIQDSPLPVLQQIRDLLQARGVPYRELHHEPTRTSEDSARVRGEALHIGGKALLIKVDDDFKLFVLSAALKVNSQAIRTRFQARKTRFASAEELKALTGLDPGSVPPFGRPILPFELYADASIVANERIAFNAGSLTDSMILGVEHYIAIAQPQVFPFAV